jgi:hypothetical protein
MGIASAVHEGTLARVSALSLEHERRERARRLQDFEDLLESVEAQNLGTQRGIAENVLDAIAELERSLAVPAPPAVLNARSGVRLHEALLAWQGALLDELRPHRLIYGDRFD